MLFVANYLFIPGAKIKDSVIAGIPPVVLGSEDLAIINTGIPMRSHLCIMRAAMEMVSLIHTNIKTI